MKLPSLPVIALTVLAACGGQQIQTEQEEKRDEVCRPILEANSQNCLTALQIGTNRIEMDVLPNAQRDFLESFSSAIVGETRSLLGDLSAIVHVSETVEISCNYPGAQEDPVVEKQRRKFKETLQAAIYYLGGIIQAKRAQDPEAPKD